MTFPDALKKLAEKMPEKFTDLIYNGEFISPDKLKER